MLAKMLVLSRILNFFKYCFIFRKDTDLIYQTCLVKIPSFIIHIIIYFHWSASLSTTQSQKFVTKCENPFSPSGILQESIDSHHITLYDKLKYLWESTIDSHNFVKGESLWECIIIFSTNFWHWNFYWPSSVFLLGSSTRRKNYHSLTASPPPHWHTSTFGPKLGPHLKFEPEN